MRSGATTEGGDRSPPRTQDGDGLRELVKGGGGAVLDVDGVDVGPAWALYRGLPPNLPTVGSESAAQVVTAHGRTYGIDAGDVTGDGIPDLAFFGPFLYQGWVLPGPLPMDGTLVDGMDSDLVWIGTYRDPDEWCVEVVMGGDYDADGVNDVLCNTQAYTEEGTLEFFRGGRAGVGLVRGQLHRGRGQHRAGGGRVGQRRRVGALFELHRVFLRRGKRWRALG